MKKISLTIFLAIILYIAGYSLNMANGHIITAFSKSLFGAAAKPGIRKTNSGFGAIGHNAGVAKSNGKLYNKTGNLITGGPDVIHVPTLAYLMSYAGSETAIVVDTALKGGLFILQTGSPALDYGIKFKSAISGTYWLRQIDNTYVLPEWFGALGNGVQNDAPYINKAILAANANSIGQVTLRNVSYLIDSTIVMKQGVSLTGSLQSATTNPALTRTILTAHASLHGDVILYDFTNDAARLPINSNLYNLNINMDSTSTTAGSGVHLNKPTLMPKILNGIQIINVQVNGSPTFGFWNEENVNGVKYTKCYASRNADNGFEMEGRDTQIDYCASYNNTGNGLYVNGNSLRVTNCDFFVNARKRHATDADTLLTGNGIRDDGFVNYYENVVSNDNYNNGILVATGTTTLTSKREIKFINCRVFANSRSVTNAFSDINIGSYTDAPGEVNGISTVISNCQLSYAAASPLLTVKYSINIDAKPTFMLLSDNTFYEGGLEAGQTNLSPCAAKYAHIINCTQQTDVVSNIPIDLADADAAPNINRGFIFKTNNTSATTINSLRFGQPGQKIILLIEDDHTSVNFTGSLHGGDNSSSMPMFNGNSLTCYCADGTNWYCILNPTPPALAPAYTFKANNTSSAATATDVTFKEIGEQPYTGTITWLGGTAPTGPTAHVYNWRQVGHLVTLNIFLKYDTAGITNTGVAMALPADCPAPYLPSSIPMGSNNIISAQNAKLSNLINSTGVVAENCVLRVNLAANGYELYTIINSSTSAKYVWVTAIYTSI